jgi:hypothetical protein
MDSPFDFVWLASFPRSGNTFLRTILWNCFGLFSGSVYPNDLGGKKDLETRVGHVEYQPGGKLVFPQGQSPILLKTHEADRDDRPAIYVVRDGRAATVSLWEFYGKRFPLELIINGQHQFGTWEGHVLSWKLWQRPHTLFLRYEEMAADFPRTLKSLASFLQREPRSTIAPDRDDIAATDGRWVKKKGKGWSEHLSGPLLQRFYELNSNGMGIAGYAAVPLPQSPSDRH